MQRARSDGRTEEKTKPEVDDRDRVQKGRLGRRLSRARSESNAELERRARRELKTKTKDKTEKKECKN